MSGAVVAGDVVAGAVVSGTVVVGAVVIGAVVSGTVVAGDVVTGAAVSATAVASAVMLAAVVSGAVVAGDVVTGAVVSGTVVASAVMLAPWCPAQWLLAMLLQEQLCPARWWQALWCLAQWLPVMLCREALWEPVLYPAGQHDGTSAHKEHVDESNIGCHWQYANQCICAGYMVHSKDSWKTHVPIDFCACTLCRTTLSLLNASKVIITQATLLHVEANICQWRWGHVTGKRSETSRHGGTGVVTTRVEHCAPVML